MKYDLVAANDGTRKQSEHVNMPINTITACVMEQDKEAILKYECNDCISKPINDDILLDTINKYIDY